MERLTELNAILDMEHKDNEIVDVENLEEVFRGEEKNL